MEHVICQAKTSNSLQWKKKPFLFFSISGIVPRSDDTQNTLWYDKMRCRIRICLDLKAKAYSFLFSILIFVYAIYFIADYDVLVKWK